MWTRIRFRGWKLKEIVRPNGSDNVVAGLDVGKRLEEAVGRRMGCGTSSDRKSRIGIEFGASHQSWKIGRERPRCEGGRTNTGVSELRTNVKLAGRRLEVRVRTGRGIGKGVRRDGTRQCGGAGGNVRLVEGDGRCRDFRSRGRRNAGVAEDEKIGKGGD